MDSSKLAFKLFLENPSALASGEIVPVFHNLIQQKAVPDHLLIDVADYEHVPNGPGSLLVSHEANIHLDDGQGRRGLLYIRKQPIAGDLPERIRQVLRYTLEVAHKLEQHPSLAGRVKFKTDELAFRINDRLHGPNSTTTYEAIKPALEAVLAEAYPIADLTLEYRPASPLDLFEVKVKSSTNPGAAAMLECLGFFPAVA
ncbi:hypothetical protein [Humisphaera borealis]|uniref:Uncharacterized protein n=1 Tax=Humisphaera borealis TaxID=2807512 RepID=A0A7M2WVJ2_9BACT|nr:hypothetical protein [Humisphaera borealis]QOV89505.1 hypothetical protein IPV69_25480 [Humisphaera borealis]